MIGIPIIIIFLVIAVISVLGALRMLKCQRYRSKKKKTVLRCGSSRATTSHGMQELNEWHSLTSTTDSRFSETTYSDWLKILRDKNGKIYFTSRASAAAYQYARLFEVIAIVAKGQSASRELVLCFDASKSVLWNF